MTVAHKRRTFFCYSLKRCTTELSKSAKRCRVLSSHIIYIYMVNVGIVNLIYDAVRQFSGKKNLYMIFFYIWHCVISYSTFCNLRVTLLNDKEVVVMYISDT